MGTRSGSILSWPGASTISLATYIVWYVRITHGTPPETKLCIFFARAFAVGRIHQTIEALHDMPLECNTDIAVNHPTKGLMYQSRLTRLLFPACSSTQRVNTQRNTRGGSGVQPGLDAGLSQESMLLPVTGSPSRRRPRSRGYLTRVYGPGTPKVAWAAQSPMVSETSMPCSHAQSHAEDRDASPYKTPMVDALVYDSLSFSR